MPELFDDTNVERKYCFDISTTSSDGTAKKDTIELNVLGWEKVSGDIVWKGAHVLASQLAQAGVDGVKGKSVLELGAGSGLLGMLAAKLGGHAVITDGDEREMPTLQENAANFEDGLQLGGTLSAAFLDWGYEGAKAAEQAPESRLKKHSFDLVLGSDIVYIPQYIPLLAQSIGYFLSPDGEGLIANTAVATRTNQSEAQELFLRSLDEAGLQVQVETPEDKGVFEEGGQWAKTDYYLRIRHKAASA